MAIPQYIVDILKKRFAGQELTGPERASLQQWYSSETAGNTLLGESDWEKELLSYMQVSADKTRIDRAFDKFISAVTTKPVLAETAVPKRKDPSMADVNRVHFLRRNWMRYAAAVILLAGATIAIILSQTRLSPSPETNIAKAAPPDLPPGGNKATLTLADGSRINLDSAADGQLANQGGVHVLKLLDGQIAYNTRGAKTAEAMWNTVSTPNGGQYQVELPDRTKVWLNAASSITFPTAFTGETRKVSIRGEVYLEVTRNKQQPFLVDVDGRAAVEVLGTRFNIHAYADEDSIKTTLVDGSVKVLAGGFSGQLRSTNATEGVVLKPGLQAAQSVQSSTTAAQRRIVVSEADLGQALAWKNGIFNFEGLDLPSVMKQLERWYDIKVQYQGAVPSIRFEGALYRSINLSVILEMLEKMNVKTRLDGKTLTVL